MAYADPRPWKSTDDTDSLEHHQKWMSYILREIQHRKDRLFSLSERLANETSSEEYDHGLEEFIRVWKFIKNRQKHYIYWFNAARTIIQARIDKARAAERNIVVHLNTFLPPKPFTTVLPNKLSTPDATHGTMFSMGIKDNAAPNVELLALAYARAVIRLLTPERDKRTFEMPRVRDACHERRQLLCFNIKANRIPGLLLRIA